jgi:hypothetical protein
MLDVDEVSRAPAPREIIELRAPRGESLDPRSHRPSTRSACTVKENMFVVHLLLGLLPQD